MTIFLYFKLFLKGWIVSDPTILFWIAVSVADAADVNPSGIKMILANGVSLFFINGKTADFDCLRKLRNHSS